MNYYILLGLNRKEIKIMEIAISFSLFLLIKSLAMDSLVLLEIKQCLSIIVEEQENE